MGIDKPAKSEAVVTETERVAEEANGRLREDLPKPAKDAVGTQDAAAVAGVEKQAPAADDSADKAQAASAKAEKDKEVPAVEKDKQAPAAAVEKDKNAPVLEKEKQAQETTVIPGVVIEQDGQDKTVPAAVKDAPDQTLKTLPKVQVEDMYSFHQGPGDAPVPGKEGDNKPADDSKPGDGPGKPVDSAEEAHLKAYREKLEKENFTLKAIEKGWGPYQSLENMVKEGKIKMSAPEMASEAKRIRDRDFKALNRDYYKVGEAPVRYTKEEIEQKVEVERQAYQKAEAKKAEEAARQAEAAKQQAEREAAARAKAEREAAERAKAPTDAPADATRNLDALIKGQIPPAEKIIAAAKASGIDFNSDKAGKLSERIEAHTRREIAAGTLKPEDLNRPIPRVGTVYVAMGAITGDELQKAIDTQNKAKAAGQQAKPLGEVLKDQFKGDEERLSRIAITSAFYENLRKEVQAKPADAPAKVAPAQDTAKLPREKAKPRDVLPETQQRIEQEGALKGKVIVIDPGHGGEHGRGAKAHIAGREIKERDLVLPYAAQLAQKLRAQGAEVHLTRAIDRDSFVSLPDRTKLADGKNPHAVIRIHANHNDKSSVTGLETYWQDAHDKPLAQAMYNSIASETKQTARPNDKVRQKNFEMNPSAPSALIEVGYMSNAQELRKITDPAYINATTNGMVNGLVNYFKRPGR